LLDEVHWLIENIGARFILCGSSARKVRRGQANLLGGRAVRYKLYPLVYPEIPDFNRTKALNSGLIPRHYMSPDPRRLLEAYVGDYLKEEIVAEALTRNRHLKGIRAFKEEFTAKHFIVVSTEAQPRRTEDGIDILPWHIFLERLWNGQIIN
jgi:hypothetical protein